MKKSTRRQIKHTTLDQKLDIDEFNALTDLLFELCKENGSRCARLCAVSRKTWNSWTTNPPRQWYWNIVLRYVIKHYIAGLNARKGLTGKHRRKVLDAMSKIPQAEEFGEEVASMAYDVHGASNYIRATLGGKGMFWDKLRLPANCGGYSTSTLRKAAKMIGVVKTQEGYGEHKRSYWRLPNEDDE